jgi:hypothetical protein
MLKIRFEPQAVFTEAGGFPALEVELVISATLPRAVEERDVLKTAAAEFEAAFDKAAEEILIPADEEMEEEFWIVQEGTERAFFADVAAPGDPNDRVKGRIPVEEIKRQMAAFLTSKAAWSKRLEGGWEFRHGGIYLETTE